MASDWLIVLSFFIGIIVVLLLVTLHEFGHFIIAKVSKAYVYEFSVGFGPRLFVIKGKETWFSVRAFPLGGYCSIASEKTDPPKGREDEEVAPDRMMEYIARWKKAFFILAGPLMNLIIAIFLFTTIYAAVGVKNNDMTWYGAKYDGTAEKALMDTKNYEENKSRYVLMGWEVYYDNGETGKNTNVVFNNIRDKDKVMTDRIVVPDENAYIYNVDDLNAVNNAASYETTVYKFIDYLKVKPKDDVKPEGVVKIRFGYRLLNNIYGSKLDSSPLSLTSGVDYVIGENIGISAPTRHFASTAQAYGYGWRATFETSLTVLKSFGMLLTGNISQFAGPVGMSRQVASMITNPDTFFLYVAMISANLFIINILTIPPLDGFKFIENIIEMIIRKEIPEKVKIWMYATGVILFLGIFIAITVHDFIL